MFGKFSLNQDSLQRIRNIEAGCHAIEITLNY